MATFQPLDFNYRVDPSLIAPPQSRFTDTGDFGLGSALGNPAATLAETPSAGPGNTISNLFGFGEGGLFSRQSLFGGTDRNTGISSMGWAPIALGLGQAIFGGIQGNKALGLAQDQFKESKRQFNLNFNAQRQNINTALEDRQRARVASNPGAYEDVDSYLKRNKV